MNKLRSASLATVVLLILLATVFCSINNSLVANAQGLKTKKILTGSFPIELTDMKNPAHSPLGGELDVSDFSQIRIETRIVTSDKEIGGVLLLKRPGCEECIVETVSLSSNFNSQLLEVPGTNLRIVAAIYRFGAAPTTPASSPASPTETKPAIEVTIYGR
jgi:hypothetical protein